MLSTSPSGTELRLLSLSFFLLSLTALVPYGRAYEGMTATIMPNSRTIAPSPTLRRVAITFIMLWLYPLEGRK